MAITQPPTPPVLRVREHLPAEANPPPVPPRGRGPAAVLTVAALAVRPQLIARVTGTLKGALSVETPVRTHG